MRVYSSVGPSKTIYRAEAMDFESLTLLASLDCLTAARVVLRCEMAPESPRSGAG
jgi:hypothetical protein